MDIVDQTMKLALPFTNNNLLGVTTTANVEAETFIANLPKLFAKCAGESSKCGQPIILHCAKSCRPIELFANENCKLWNEAEMNATFERGSAQDPRRNPLSAAFDDAST